MLHITGGRNKSKRHKNRIDFLGKHPRTSSLGHGWEKDYWNAGKDAAAAAAPTQKSTFTYFISGACRLLFVLWKRCSLFRDGEIWLYMQKALKRNSCKSQKQNVYEKHLGCCNSKLLSTTKLHKALTLLDEKRKQTSAEILQIVKRDEFLLFFFCSAGILHVKRWCLMTIFRRMDVKHSLKLFRFIIFLGFKAELFRKMSFGSRKIYGGIIFVIINLYCFRESVQRVSERDSVFMWRNYNLKKLGE